MRTHLGRTCALFAFAAAASGASAQESRAVTIDVVEADASGRVAPVPKRYWADTGGNAIRRSNLDGTQAEAVITGLGTPYGIGYDSTAGNLLWTSSDSEVVQAGSPQGGPAVDLESSFEEGYVLVRREGDFDIAYAVLDSALVKVTQNRLTGAEQQETLLPLSSPEAVHGLAFSADGTSLYLGDAVGRMTRRLRLADRVVMPIAFSEGPTSTPTATPTEPPTPRPTPRPTATPTPTQRALPRIKPTLVPAPEVQ